MAASNGRFIKGNIPHNKQNLNINLILKLYNEENIGCKRIAERLGIKDWKAIYRRLKKLGIKIKNKGTPKGTYGHLSNNYKGGCIRPDGYKSICYKGKSILEHHFVWIRENQIPIPQRCEIHHRNGYKSDNRIENLMLLPKSFHAMIHSNQRWSKLQAHI